ncbi:hypothetical protein CQY20_33355 [Mycolicibacterium agri]|uniref:Uncharacterized protein n=1 Tax=Mycolicibacterium agri TaxID=36811 RepID=A0A2A7MN18_MYCAG|nr:hypothetical protein [Mycolicibacterium agri]PEG32969.1 hypothetical protein CQY20_33355 [Mycolicibacterium agri]GFG51056.1 hypothetical protein MAGR_24970 [Mycolicibacterium agri]
MTREDHRRAVALDDAERKLMVLAINEYGLAAQGAAELLPPLVGRLTQEAWWAYIYPLADSIEAHEPLTDLDWARALLLTEFAFGSDMVANARRFSPRGDERWVLVLRSLQEKLFTERSTQLLVANATYPTFDDTNSERTAILPMDLGDFAFDDDERRLMLVSLKAHAEQPERGYGLLAPIAGQKTFDEWTAYIDHLHRAVDDEQFLTELDWSRVLLLTEMGFISSLAGFASHFRGADQYGIRVLRTLQVTIHRGSLALLFIENATYPWIRYDTDDGLAHE